MDLQNRLLPVKSVTELPSLLTFKKEDEESQDEYEILGNIMAGSKYCWISSGGHIQVVCLQSGRKVAARKFGTTFKNQDTYVMCGCEIPVPISIGSSIIALGLQRGSNDGSVCLFTAQGCRVLCTINIGEPVSCICLIDPGGNLTGSLSALDGILAVGTTNGNVLLLDICRQACIDALVLGPEYTFHENLPHQCLKILPKTGENYEALREMAQAKGEHLAFSIDAMSFLGQVSSLLVIAPLSALVIGSSTGAVAIVDLLEFKLIYKSKPLHGPVQHLAFQEPSDDPRAHCFLWVVHSGSIGTVANLHQLIFRRKQLIDSHSFHYQDFVSAHSPFSLTLSNEESQAISCQAIHKTIADESTLSLCVFSWISRSESYLCIFDMNQWYKRGMPGHAFIDSETGYFVIYPIMLDVNPLNYIDLKLDVASITPFKSHQRFDEYYRPGSLSFDCNVLTPTKNICLHWPGVQVNALRKLSNGGSAGLIVPTPLYLECLSVYLTPMFHETQYTLQTPVADQRDMLLSLALDYGRIGYLQCCAVAWANGSHAGPSDSGLDGGPTLRTMIDWIWKQTIRVKNHTNSLSIQLFDNSGVSLDATSRRHFTHCISQFEILLTLVRTMIESCKEYISPPVKTELESLKKALQTFTEYSEVVQFLLNIGLLPEVVDDQGHETDFGPFSAVVLKQFYDQRRDEINSVQNHSVHWGCDILFIDALVEYECGGESLRSVWLQDGGSSLYPPDSIQALLYVYLQKEVSTINKHVLFIYLFLDLASTLDDERSALALSYLFKFASVFGVNASVITNTKAFWHLDQGEFKTALELLIDPLSHTRNLAQWQHNLLLSSLVNQGAFREAMQIMRAPGPHIDPRLQLKILLENNLLCEAFECQRIWGGKELLKIFFEGCIKFGSVSSIMGLSLNEHEEAELSKFLQKSDSLKADNLRVLYYLQRSRFVEAISVNNNLHHHSYNSKHDSPTSKISTRDMIVRAFQNTLPDVAKKLTAYCNRDKMLFDKIRHVENPTPLSVSVVTMATKDPITKSSVLLEKSVQINQLQKGVKRVLGIEDTPFLRTPISTLNDHDKKSLLVYPKTISNQNEQYHCNGNGDTSTPIKRQRLDTMSKFKSNVSRNKGLRYSLHRLVTSPYNFDAIINHTSSPIVKKQSEESFTISTLSSPSTNSPDTNLSLLSTPLVKRKNKIYINQNDSINTSISSILKVPGKDSSKKFIMDISNESSVRSIHFADDASTASEISNSDQDTQSSSGEPSIERSKSSATGPTVRLSLRSSNTSKTTTKTINTASTGDDVYYSMSSGSNNQASKSENKMITSDEAMSSHSENSCHSENRSHSENLNEDEHSEKPESSASEKDFDSDHQELPRTGPRPRRSLRLSKCNDSLHKLKQTTATSSISKAKVKANESLTQKLLELASEQNKYLSRLVLETNAYKVKESSFSRKSIGPRVRDPIHPIESKSLEEKEPKPANREDISVRIQSQNVIEQHENLNHNSRSLSVQEDCNVSQTKKEKLGYYKVSSRKSTTSFRAQNEVVDNENEINKNVVNKNNSIQKSRVSFFTQNDNQASCSSSKVEISMEEQNELEQCDEEHIEVEEHKTNDICKEVHEESKSEDMDIYEDMMTDINESIRQKSQHEGKGYDNIDVEPMQTCPELIMSDERSQEKQYGAEEKTTPAKENIQILSATSITQEEFNHITKEDVIENKQLGEDINDQADPAEIDKGLDAEIENEPKKSEVINETISLIDSSDESSDESSAGSVEQHNVGAIELKDTTPDTSSENSSASEGSGEQQESSEGGSTREQNTDADDSREDDSSSGNTSANVENHERNISGDTEFEKAFSESEEDCEIIQDDDDQEEESGEDEQSEQEEEQSEEEEEQSQDEEQSEDDVMLIDEDDEIDEKERNILAVSEYSRGVETEETSRSSNSQAENNNVTNEITDEEENFVTDATNVNDQAMIVNDTEVTVNEITVQSTSSANLTDLMNVAQVELKEPNETMAIENVDRNQENKKCEEDNLETTSPILDGERLQLSIEDVSMKHDDVEEQVNEFDVTATTDNITDDLSVVEETDSDKFFPASSRKSSEDLKDSNVPERKTDSAVKDSTIGSENSYADALCESDILEKTYHTEVSIAGSDILDKTDFMHEPIDDPDRKFTAVNMTMMDPNKTQTDVLDKTEKVQEFSIISEADPLDRSQFSIIDDKIEDTGSNSDKTEITTPKTTERRRSRRLSMLSRIDENSVVDEDPNRSDDLESIASGTSVRSTKSRNRRLSTPVRDLGTPVTEYTPRRSTRLRSTDTSPASDIDASAKTTRKYTRRSSVDASPTVSSPMVTRTPTQKGRRRSLLATLTEPVIPEENSKKDDEALSQQVEEYSKERRLTRQQRTLLMRSMGPADQASSPTTSKKPTPKKRRLSRSEHSESGDDLPCPSESSQIATTPEGSISSAQTNESVRGKRSSFLKAQGALISTEKRTRRNSTQEKEKDGYESDGSVASVKSTSSKMSYKFSAPTEVAHTETDEELVTVPCQEFSFSPPKLLFKGLPTIDEERSLSPVVTIEIDKEAKEQPMSVTKSTKRGRPRKNSTSSNSSQTTPKTRSSSRNSNK